MNKSTVLTIPGSRARVTLAEVKGFKPKDLQKLKEALCVLSYVINHDDFEDTVCWDFYSSVYPVVNKKYTHTNETGPVVYDRFMKANELGTTGDDNELDFSLQYYNSWWSRVIGYTLPKQLWIWMNWKYHLHFKPWQTAGNLAHEQCHKLGYDHKSASEKTSVPYAIGYIVEELGEKYFDEAMKLMDKIEITQVGV